MLKPHILLNLIYIFFFYVTNLIFSFNIFYMPAISLDLNIFYAKVDSTNYAQPVP